MKSRSKIKCLCCKESFVVDKRNIGRQRYCSKPTCRKASKAASQAKWNQKPDNKEYFRGPDNAARARAWQAANPGYWRKRKKRGPPVEDVLQDCSSAQVIENQRVTPVKLSPLKDVLQDICPTLCHILVGFSANISGLVLQEDIAQHLQMLSNRGEDILRMPPGRPPPIYHHEKQNHPVPGASAACAPSV